MMDLTLTIPFVQEARDAARRRNHSVLAELEERTGAPATDLLRMLAALFGYGVTDTMEMRGLVPASDLLPLQLALKRECMLFRNGEVLLGVIADPFDGDLLKWLAARAKRGFETRLALKADINAYLATLEDSTQAMESVADARVDESSAHGIEQISLKAISEDASPIVRIVNSTLYDALRAGASDIHIETGRSGLTVRYRVDGVLTTATTLPGQDTAEQVISRLKVMAELDIAERRIPQDGRFKISAKERAIDIRVSIMPSIHGEDAVLRLLDKHAIVPDGNPLRLDILGFDTASLAAVRRLAAQPYGMLLVTGPTGSGKTTTLYAAISEINHGHDKIVTIEDPVEYELPGVLQIPVNEKKGLTFAKGLRSILRHDPDKILVGEIRDAETAEIAIQSALTGHLVLTTVHANNVFDVFNRFTHMGIDPYALTSALNGVWAQRLLRTICTRCAVDHAPDIEELALVGLHHDPQRNDRFRKGRGCGECRGTGYRGRRAIAEILTLDDRLRELIAARESILSIKQAAAKAGTRFLREAALDLARAGETTLEEVARVTLQA
ncbi:GspE/PulE family protein [Denitratisoma oestradiolicum]|uniref:Type II secretion system protein E n=1 Tax=Denitratisoma oestradiolicum TaxID=311182 RepID=A0A6S6Y317_9PROT|nr:GspE/PulE family protein [Denitratisoma oestradiolicum]TWO79989.1 general secretion pathway protein GspE [Denitratisoma oestradiolicum]CAB1369753.1 Type II secretion system protein E [Denitratisoma oestradiolicum]